MYKLKNFLSLIIKVNNSLFLIGIEVLGNFCIYQLLQQKQKNLIKSMTKFKFNLFKNSCQKLSVEKFKMYAN